MRGVPCTISSRHIRLLGEHILKRSIAAFILTVILFIPANLFASEDIRTDSVSDNQTISQDTYKTEPVSAESADQAPVSPDYRSALPAMYKTALDTLKNTDAGKIATLEKNLHDLIASGKDSAAAAAAGAAVGAEQKASVQYLGTFCSSVLPSSGEDFDSRLKFLTGFVKGYGKGGLLVFKKEGLTKFRVYGKRRGTPYKSVQQESSAADKLERIYSYGMEVYVPMHKGELLKVDLIASGTSDVKMWKALSGGMNSKVWKSGKWEREVTVRGDKVF